jgi:cardiolipin-specific phospholipase
MSSDTESGGQRPMLASQRKDTSSDSNKTGKPAYFPLGYKEGFSQWVRTLFSTARPSLY